MYVFGENQKTEKHNHIVFVRDSGCVKSQTYEKKCVLDLVLITLHTNYAFVALKCINKIFVFVL